MEDSFFRSHGQSQTSGIDRGYVGINSAEVSFSSACRCFWTVGEICNNGFIITRNLAVG